MSAQHTLGPWTVKLSNEDSGEPRDVEVVAEADSPGNFGIAFCGTTGNHWALPNARLIAAAPDLLAALRICLQSIKAMPRTKQAEDIQAECGMFSASAAASSAIAKATGGDHD